MNVASANASPILMVELLSRHLGIVLVTQVTRVRVIVAATERERPGVINDGCCPNDAISLAHLAQSVGALQPAQPLRLTGTAA